RGDALAAVCVRGRDDQQDSVADVLACQALVPACDNRAAAEDVAGDLLAGEGRVELLAGAPVHAYVLQHQALAGADLGAGAVDQDLRYRGRGRGDAGGDRDGGVAAAGVAGDLGEGRVGLLRLGACGVGGAGVGADDVEDVDEVVLAGDAVGGR